MQRKASTAKSELVVRKIISVLSSLFLIISLAISVPKTPGIHISSNAISGTPFYERPPLNEKGWKNILFQSIIANEPRHIL